MLLYCYQKSALYMPNCFALHCGPLGHQDPIFISYIPDLKHWKTGVSGFWQTTGKRKFQPQAFPWKILCQRSVADSSSTATFTIFSLARKCCHVAEFCTIQKVMGYSAHPGCIYIAVRSLTDVGEARVPQPGALYIHLLHNQATLEVSTVQTGTLTGCFLAQYHFLSPGNAPPPLLLVTLFSPTLSPFLFRGQSGTATVSVEASLQSPFLNISCPRTGVAFLL